MRVARCSCCDILTTINVSIPNKVQLQQGYRLGEYCERCWLYVPPPRDPPPNKPASPDDIGPWQEFAIRCMEDIDLEDDYLTTE